MVLPLGLLTAAQGHAILVELKTGVTLNGHLVNCDTWMNMTLKAVVETSVEGDKFLKLDEVYVRGSNVKYLRLEDEVMEVVKEQQMAQREGGRGDGRRPDRGGRGDRRGGRGGGPDRGRRLRGRTFFER